MSGTGAEVEVDTETGHVKVERLISVVDVGKPINPQLVDAQISGAALMQLGFTMFEEMHLDGGQVVNASLADYKIPGFHDVPDTIQKAVTLSERPVSGAGGVYCGVKTPVPMMLPARMP